LYRFILGMAAFSPSGGPSPPTILAKFVVTNIDVQPSPSSTSATVEFHAFMKASPTGAAVVLQDIQDTGRKYRSTGGWFCAGRETPIFSGVRVDPTEVEDAIQKEQARATRSVKSPTTLLLCVHGFNTQPADWLRTCAGYTGNFTVIPVLWPASDKLAFWQAYREDQSNAPATGASFRPLLKCLEQIGGKKSLLCYSMGNFVLKWIAPPQPPERRFENIFMVAADVDQNIFDDQQEAGKRILSMANRVHVLYSNTDLALWARQTITMRTGTPALGFSGPRKVDQNGPRKVDQNKVASLKCNAFSRSNGDWVGHGYVFAKNAIDFYESCSVG
jgi:esterase/lipase superfamily enzyme